MSSGIFHRVEKKYLVDAFQHDEIIKVLHEKMILDKYSNSGGNYHIQSLYYDTSCNRFISETYLDSRYKEKLRIRAYGIPSLDNTVYVEIKKKINRIGNKRRYQMPLVDAYHFLESGGFPNVFKNGNIQVLNEINAMAFQRGINFRPFALISYDRIAFNSEEDNGLRISFDTNLQGRTHNLRLESQEGGLSLINQKTAIMEIKAIGAMPLWLTRLLSLHQVYPRSFSKYKVMYHSILRQRHPQIVSSYERR